MSLRVEIRTSHAGAKIRRSRPSRVELQQYLVVMADWWQGAYQGGLENLPPYDAARTILEPRWPF